MGDPMHGLVGALGGQVVQQQDRRATGEIVLQHQDLAAIPQGTLRQKPDLGQAVEHDAVGLSALHRFENLLVVSPSSRSEE